jgi:organic hydroperoxide reductase OsmC/OhrA
MDKSQDLAHLVADLDWIIERLEGTDTGMTTLCLKMARVELQMKMHNVSDEEFSALCELIQAMCSVSDLDS